MIVHNAALDGACATIDHKNGKRPHSSLEENLNLHISVVPM